MDNIKGFNEAESIYILDCMQCLIKAREFPRPAPSKKSAEHMIKKCEDHLKNIGYKL